MLTLLTFVYTRATGRARQPRKRISRARQRWIAILRYVDSVTIVGGLFGLTVIIVHSNFIFVLLPTGLFVVLAFLVARSYVANLKALVVSTVLALLYFSAVTGFELLTHNTHTAEIIVVTTTLAVALMFAPLGFGAMRLLDQRFHLRDDAISRTVEAFTATLREEINLDQVRDRFFEVVRKTLQPGSLAMWSLAPAENVPQAASAPAFDGSPVWEPAQPAASSASIATIAGDDPLVAYVLKHSGILDVERAQLDSATLRTLKIQGAELALPLVSQGELLSLLALGPRLDGLEYTREDRNLLAMLAAQVAPALRVGQLVREQQARVRERERIEQELRTAQVIQHTFLPKVVPSLAGWQLATCYQPAREVGGDFYDFLPFEDGRLGIIIGDVTDKGIPAALVMTATRTMLRTASRPDTSPGEVFARVNDLLAADIPPGMFVTCFYAILDPASGRLRFANAGQDLPYLRHADGSVGELHATGMPLGLMPGSRYEEGETTLVAGDTLLFFSDGLVEAHNPQREMFGLPRLKRLVGARADGPALLDAALAALKSFAGAGWEQEDDVTLVTLRRGESGDDDDDDMDPTTSSTNDETGDDGTATEWRTLDAWALASVPGNERDAIARLAQVVHDLPLAPARLERLKTAVGEATVNAMEHGNGYQPERLVALEVRASATAIAVRITDQGSHQAIPAPQTPDLDAKLAGQQSPRGWGLFLMRGLVDEVRVTGDETHHTVELIIALDGSG